MARSILMDEFHVMIYVPRLLAPPECDRIRQTLDEPSFLAALRQAIRTIVQRQPALGKVRVSVTR